MSTEIFNFFEESIRIPYPANKNLYFFFKRIFDVFFAFTGILFLLPFFLLISILVKLDSKGPVFYKQVRVGRNFRKFFILKFRTMNSIGGAGSDPITCRGDARITKIGKFLRRYKLDELPQLLNVLKGEMSLVGPRPEIPKFVSDNIIFETVLKIKPGITDFASINFFNEEEILHDAKLDRPDINDFYTRFILPSKLKLNLKYMDNMSIFLDVSLIIKTLFCIKNKNLIPKN